MTQKSATRRGWFGVVEINKSMENERHQAQIIQSLRFLIVEETKEKKRNNTVPFWYAVEYAPEK